MVGVQSASILDVVQFVVFKGKQRDKRDYSELITWIVVENMTLL